MYIKKADARHRPVAAHNQCRWNQKGPRGEGMILAVSESKPDLSKYLLFLSLSPLPPYFWTFHRQFKPLPSASFIAP